MNIARRSLLKAGLGLGLSSGLPGLGNMALAADGDRHATVFSSAGVMQSVLKELMNQQGFFRQVGIDADMQLISDGNKILAGLIGGNGDMCGGSGFSSLFPAIAKGASIKIIAGAAVVPLTCIYTRRADIKSAKDLVGKTVGTGAPGALLHELVVGLLIKHGIDYTQVKFVNVGSSTDVFRAVIAGTVDAGPGENDLYDHQDKYGVHALEEGGFWDALPEYTNQAMFTTDETIATKRDVLVRCLAAYAKLFRFIQSPDSADAWRKARAVALGKDEPDESYTQWKFFQDPKRLARDLVLGEASTEYVQNLNVKLGVQPSVLPFDKVADMSLAKEALKMLG
jgi:ABC-type nitrate/sulfonate/bicarbonate transport system substrate-binding protein